MSDKTLRKAKLALEEWRKNVTTEQFVEDHKRLGLTKENGDKLLCPNNEHIYSLLCGYIVCMKCSHIKVG